MQSTSPLQMRETGYINLIPASSLRQGTGPVLALPTASPFASRAEAITGNPILTLLQNLPPETISFAGGLPPPDTFPIDVMMQASQVILSNPKTAETALQYAASAGYLPLREWVANALSTAGMKITVDRVLIVSGAQQGLDLLGKILLDPSDHFAVENPTYPGALETFQAYQGVPAPLLCDQRGPMVEGIRSLPADTKLVYLVPNHQNPTGRTIPHERRLELLDACKQRNLLVVEDDPYLHMHYKGHCPQTMVSMSPEQVVYIGTFSKIIAPGLRVGYVIAPKPVIEKMKAAQSAAVLHTAQFNQILVHEIVRTGFLEDRRLPALRSRYAAQCKVMLEALEQSFPTGISWSVPEGGMFIWVTLPANINCRQLLPEAVRHGVAFVPGDAFYAGSTAPNTLRLSFATESGERIVEGVATLGKILAARMREASSDRV